jgi:hypothetical protein
MSVFVNVFILTTILSGILAGQEIGGCPMFPKNNIWNTRIDDLPVHPSSAQYIASNGVDRSLHPDFGNIGGLPYIVVPQDQKMVPITFIEGVGNSDPGPYPIPPNPAIEAGSDAHVLIVQRGSCKLYEVYEFKTKPDGSYTGYAGALFELRSNALRPDGWTSADAAGLPILPGLVRYDEIEAGEIKHAIRLTVPRTRRAYEWPGRHFASQSNDSALPPMGQRFRLKASYDISGFDPKVQVLLRALQRYGMMLADNGQSWFLTGTTDNRWTELWNQIKQIKGSDLEAVDVSSLMVNPNTGQAASQTVIGRQEVAFLETPVFDAKSGNTISIRLSGDVRSSTLLNPPDGIGVTFLICQDDQGGRSFEWPPNVSGGMRIGGAPRTCSAQQFTSDGQRLYATTPGVIDLNQE